MSEKKEKRYVSDNARLMAEWDFEKNAELEFDPQKLTCGSGKKVWWKCLQEHEWQSAIKNRNNGNGCPYCSGKRVIVGKNDLQTVNPSLAQEWNYEKNCGLTPKDVLPNSNKKAWWKCYNGHQWQASIFNRNKGSKCPYCSNQKVLKGYNDLKTVNPTLAKEWNFEKNGGLMPTDVMAHSHIKVWWKCEKGHEWLSTIDNRSNGYNCPYCSNQRVLIGYNDLKTTNPSLAMEWNYEKNCGLTPKDVTPNSGTKVWWRCSKSHEWKAAIYSRNAGCGCPVCHLEKNTSFPEYAIIYYLQKYNLYFIHSFKENSYELDVYIPSKKIAIEYDGYFWHKDKIEKDLVKNSKCRKDNITLYRIREGLPTLNDSSMDYTIRKDQKDLSDALKKVLSEIIGLDVDVDIERDSVEIDNLREYMENENSLTSSNPQIAYEWNYERNGDLRPEHFSSKSGKKVWWRCSKGHEWRAIIYNRNKGEGCPFCSNKRLLKGYNDIQTVNPVVASEWNYEKNLYLTPANFTLSSGKNVWWKCINGHEWRAVISYRNRGIGCPYCSGRYVIKSENDLQTVNPILAKEWNYDKNDRLTPLDVLPNSNKKVWWRCSEGHEWSATVSQRTKGNSCPYCWGRYAIKGENDLQTVNPTLAKEWNYDKNDRLTPLDVLPNSNKKVWWRCIKGHEYQSIVQNRNKGSGCPYCAGQKAIKGCNDLQTINPTLAQEWNYEKNNGLTPVDVMPNSGKKVWWRCFHGHEWQATINDRNHGTICPYCSGRRKLST